MAEKNKEQVIKEISKNSLEKIIVSLRNYRGRQLVDVRTYYLREGSNEWLPTKKGVSISTEKYPDLKEAVLLLEEAIRDF